MKKNWKLMSILLVVVMISQVLFLGVSGFNFGESADNIAYDDNYIKDEEDASFSKLDNTQSVNQKKEIVVEIEALRDETTKHFYNADGSYTAVSYAAPVHYKLNGMWKDIDARLELSDNTKSTANKASYVPKAGTVPISIPQDLTKGQKLTISHKGYTVGFGISINNQNVTLQSAAILTDIDSLTSAVLSNTTSKSESISSAKTQLDVVQEKNDEKTTLKNLSSAVTYKNVFPDTDLEYIVTATGIKENIVVKAAKSEYRYYFDMYLGGLDAVIQEDGSILLVEKNNLKEPVFILQAAYMYDANGEYSNNVTMTIENGMLTMVADKEWINSDERAFPIVIDPTYSVYGNTGPGNLDTYVHTGDTACNHSSQLNLRAGRATCPTATTPNTFVDHVALIKPYLPPINGTVTGAYFDLRMVYDYTKIKVSAYRVTSSWSNSLKYSSVSSKIDESSAVSPAYGTNFYQWNITNIAKNWYSGASTNYGLAFKKTDTTYNDFFQDFHACDATDANVRPTITVYYENNFPTITSVTGNPSAWTTQNVTLTVNAVDHSGRGLHATAYSFDDGATWQSAKTKTFTSNDAVYIRVRDAAGNSSKITTVTIEHIDKTAPKIWSVDGNPTAWTNASVTLTVNSTENTGESGFNATAYSFDDGATWQSGTTKTFTSNQTVYVKTRDAVGNISARTTITINRIDKTAPAISSVAGNPTSPTSFAKLTVTAADTGGSGLNAVAYSFDDGVSWQTGKNKSFTKNQTVKIKVKDAAGNVSAATTVNITNISALNWPSNLGEHEGYYKIKHVQSGKYLTADNTSSYETYLSSSSTALSQYWMIKTVSVSSNKYNIINGSYTTRNLSKGGTAISSLGVIDGYRARTSTIAYSCYITNKGSNVYIKASDGAFALQIDYAGDIYPHFYDDSMIDELDFSEWELEPVYLKGDVDMNGKVNQDDATLVLNAAVNIETLSNLQKFLADINNDGTVATADARSILNMI